MRERREGRGARDVECVREREVKGMKGKRGKVRWDMREMWAKREREWR